RHPAPPHALSAAAERTPVGTPRASPSKPTTRASWQSRRKPGCQDSASNFRSVAGLPNATTFGIGLIAATPTRQMRAPSAVGIPDRAPAAMDLDIFRFGKLRQLR